MVDQPFNADRATPAQIVEYIRDTYDYTWAELGHQLGRSEKMLRKVAKGQSAGESYRDALTELAYEGFVTHRPPRRRTKSGGLVPVRSKRGTDEISHVPEDDAGTFVPLPPRGRFDYDRDAQFDGTDLPDGGRHDNINMPRTRGAKGRKKGMDKLKDVIRSVTKSQRAKDKRVKIRATFDTKDGRGRVMDIGSKSGYHASDILADVRNMHDGDMEAWINDQAFMRYLDMDPGENPVVGIEIVSYDSGRAKEQRKMEDMAGTRRRNRDAKGQRKEDRRPGRPRRRGRGK